MSSTQTELTVSYSDASTMSNDESVVTPFSIEQIKDEVKIL